MKLIDRLNIVPFGRYGVDEKPKKGVKNNLPKWKEWQDKYCGGEIPADGMNHVLITGFLPDCDIQVVAIDIDGNCWLEYGMIYQILYKNYNLEPFMVNKTQGGGIHYIFLLDAKISVRNVQKKPLSKESSIMTRCNSDDIHGIDIRGNGGLVFYPPTMFSDSKHPYVNLMNLFEEQVLNDTSDMLVFMDDVFDDNVEQEKIDFHAPSLLAIKRDVEFYNNEISSLREPFRQLLSPGAPDIEEICKMTRVQEFLYWKALWIEVIYREVNHDVIYRLLDKHQRSFDKRETLHQLKYIRSDARPFTNKKLKEMFPWWDSPRENRTRAVYRGFI